jgi:F420-dependent oxidoreductase-like protein
MRAMDLCLMIEGQEGVSWPQWLDLAGACEQHGIGTLFRSDHYMNLDGQHPERGSLDAWGTLCALAAATTTLRLGTMVSPATFRHPSQLAKVVATADHVSGGRVELGLGAGWLESEHRAYGFPFHDTRTRMDVLEEQLQIIRGQWGDGPFSFEGEHYRLDEVDALPKPVQRPGPPLVIGGSGGPRSLRLASGYADEYNTVFPSAGFCRELRAKLDDRLPLSIMTGVLVGSDRSDYDARVKALEEWNGEAGISDAWIAGTTEEAVAQLRELEDAGVTRVMLQNLLHRDLEHVELIGRGIIPAIA